MTVGKIQEGAIEEFISGFNQYEANQGYFDLRDRDEFPWWDLVRYRVQFALCAERGFYGRQKSAPSPKIVRARSFMRQSWQLVRDVATLSMLAPSHVQILVVSSRALPHVTTILDEEKRQGRRAIMFNKEGFAPAPHVAVAGQSIAFFTRLYANACQMPSDIEEDVRRLADQIRKRFQSDVDFFALMSRKYCEHLAAQKAWSFVLNRSPAVDRIIYANDDTLKTLVFLAHGRGIATEEAQHAYMGRSHIGFSYPPLTRLPETLPDRVIINRDTGDITYPVHKVIVQRHPTNQATDTTRDLDVLIAASPVCRDETIGIVTALADKGLRLAVKLHPMQTQESSGLRAHFPPEIVAIHTGSEDFCTLASRAHVFVPANVTSTTALEAVENGARLVVVDFGGVKRTSMNDGIVSARADSLEALPNVIWSQLNTKHPAAGGSKGICHET